MWRSRTERKLRAPHLFLLDKLGANQISTPLFESFSQYTVRELGCEHEVLKRKERQAWVQLSKGWPLTRPPFWMSYGESGSSPSALICFLWEQVHTRNALLPVGSFISACHCWWAPAAMLYIWPVQDSVHCRFPGGTCLWFPTAPSLLTMHLDSFPVPTPRDPDNPMVRMWH